MSRTPPHCKIPVILTIGHSSRELLEFLELLRAHHVERLVDVRSFPTSRKFPHFSQQSLPTHLAKAGIRYDHLKGLGGLRKSGLEDSPNRGWQNKSFRNYADHMLTDDFRRSLESLFDIASGAKTTILCAEAVPWRCHRQLIADALLGLKRIRVLHILGPDRLQDHRLTPFAKVQAEGTIHYPEVQSSLFPEPSGVRGIEE